MGASGVIVCRDGGVVTVLLNRPEKMNALNKEIFEDLKSAVDVIETDPGARALIITGAGDKAFCVGADLKERQGMNEKDVLLRFDFVRALYQRLDNLGIPTVAAINGICLGGGLELALCCDLRVAMPTSVLGFPEVELGIIPGNGGTQRLLRLVGKHKALELILLAKRISANEAHQCGIIHSLAKDAITHARVITTRLLECGPIALKQAKMAIKRGEDLPLTEGLKLEVECYKPCLYSKDRVEGLKAFGEKRKPEYRGE